MKVRSAINLRLSNNDVDLEEVFRAYIQEPRSFWRGVTIRQAEKLEAKRDSVNKHMGWSDPDIASSCLAWAKKRGGRYPPIFVTGLGGSGSHWLANMLGALPGFFDVGEVYIPERLEKAMNRDPETARVVLDALHVLHTRHPAADDARAVNCAAGSHRGIDYLRWDPGASVARLLRDPRDQVLSTTFRKAEFREWVAPDVSDDEYLHRRCSISWSDELRYQQSGCSADLVIKYEDLTSDTMGQLGRVLACAEIQVDDALLRETVDRHKATRIRSGQSDVKGNLSMKTSPPWREESLSKTAPIHSELVAVIEAQAYPFGMCLLPPPSSDVREIVTQPHVGMRLRGWTDDGWQVDVMRSDAFLAEISSPRLSQVSSLHSVGVYGICAARAKSLPDGWLEGILRIPSLKTVDFGSVTIAENQLGMLVELGSQLRALNLWRSCSRVELDYVRHRLPTTTVVG